MGRKKKSDKGEAQETQDVPVLLGFAGDWLEEHDTSLDHYSTKAGGRSVRADACFTNTKSFTIPMATLIYPFLGKSISLEFGSYLTDTSWNSAG